MMALKPLRVMVLHISDSQYLGMQAQVFECQRHIISGSGHKPDVKLWREA